MLLFSAAEDTKQNVHKSTNKVIHKITNENFQNDCDIQTEKLS